MSKIDRLRSVWVVGASTGIGKALVRELDSAERTLYVSARNVSGLDQLRDRSAAAILPYPLDITDSVAVEKAAAAIGQSANGLDLLIVNAGTCEYIDSDRIDTDAVRRVLETNFLGAGSVVNASLPLLRRAKALRPDINPQLVLVSSSVTYQALPRAGAYGASKAALRYFAECLKIDLQKEGIDVRIVSPGFVKTPLTDKNDFDMPFLLSAEVAARRIVRGLGGKQFDINFPYRFTKTLKLFSWLPASWRFTLLSKMSRHEPPSGYGTHVAGKSV